MKKVRNYVENHPFKCFSVLCVLVLCLFVRIMFDFNPASDWTLQTECILIPMGFFAFIGGLVVINELFKMVFELLELAKVIICR